VDTGPFTLRGHVPRILPALALATPDIHPLRPRSLQNPCYNPRSNLSAEQDWDITNPVRHGICAVQNMDGKGDITAL